MTERKSKSLYWRQGSNILHGKKKHDRPQKDGVIPEWIEQASAKTDILKRIEDLKEASKDKSIPKEEAKAIKAKIKQLKLFLN